MTNKIKLLDAHLADKIAAGEVVERPASVVKELLENALDAGADTIDVAVEQGGFQAITLKDNGCGMNAADAKMAFERHATSKISCEADLYSLRSFGFRGEAISSIAAVAKVKLRTREQKSPAGYELENNGGKLERETLCACTEGTIWEIRDLFFNTPVRKKFLKTPGTEFGHIAATVTQSALAFPDRAFKLSHNKQITYDLPRHQTLPERIYALLGREVWEKLIPIDGSGCEIGIKGFLATPAINRNSRRQQYLFVNQRPIQSPIINRAVQDAYHSLLPAGRHPLFVFNLEINPLEIDVNVHPRKLEVRFLRPTEIYEFVRAEVKKALAQNDLTPKIAFTFTEKQWERDRPQPAAKHINMSPNSAGDFPARQLFSVAENDQEKITFSGAIQTLPETKLRPIAQVNNSYLIAGDEDGLVIIDQHAAHERINYAKLKEAWEKNLANGLLKQQLLNPITLDINPAQAAALMENQAILANMGFEIEEFGGGSYLLRTGPSLLRNSDYGELLISLLDELSEGKAPKEIEARVERIINFMACHAAIKFGRFMEQSEQSALLRDLERIEQKFTCPHGRPTMIRFNFNELAKKFGR